MNTSFDFDRTPSAAAAARNRVSPASALRNSNSNSNRNRIRARSWSSSSRPTRLLPRSSQQPPPGVVVVRTGPLFVALAVLCVVPLLMISFSEKTAVQDSYDPRKNDNRAGGLWVPSHHDNDNRQKRWYNEDYTVLSSTASNNAENDDHSSRHLAAAAGDAERARNSCHLHKVRTSTKTTTTSLDNDTDDDTIKDWLFLEVSHDQVMIAIVLEGEQDDDNTQQQRWILTEEQHYAIPDSTLQTPVSGQIRNNEAPFAAALRVTYSILRMDDEFTVPDIPLVLDKYHLADGSILESHSSRQELQWEFLGRYRNLADAGGGFTYTYMLKAPPYVSNVIIPMYMEILKRNGNAKQKENRQLSNGNVDDRPTSTTLFSMSTDELRQSLLKGVFAEVKGAATIGLALQHNMVV